MICIIVRYIILCAVAFVIKKLNNKGIIYKFFLVWELRPLDKTLDKTIHSHLCPINCFESGDS